MKKGVFITFEGNDGSGKTTISKKVYEQLLAEGYDVVYTREPGGIAIAEQIREVILNPTNIAMDARCEALLYAASRRQHLVEKVIPALQAGKVVLCDRYIDSSLAYQGVGRGLGFDDVFEMNRFAIESYLPDKTIFLQLDPRIGLQRIASRQHKDRLDMESEQFHLRVAQGYDLVLQRFASRMIVVDANQNVEAVFSESMMQVHAILGHVE
ncbi:MAG: dTMP kinase [Erysipelotrichaceae bacterium]